MSQFGWSPQSYRRLILPAFEAVGLFVEGGFYCDKKEMRQLMATLLRRAKEILCIMRLDLTSVGNIVFCYLLLFCVDNLRGKR